MVLDIYRPNLQNCPVQTADSSRDEICTKYQVCTNSTPRFVREGALRNPLVSHPIFAIARFATDMPHFEGLLEDPAHSGTSNGRMPTLSSNPSPGRRTSRARMLQEHKPSTNGRAGRTVGSCIAHCPGPPMLATHLSRHVHPFEVPSLNAHVTRSGFRASCLPPLPIFFWIGPPAHHRQCDRRPVTVS